MKICLKMRVLKILIYFLALTDSDEVNVIVSILAKRLGAHKTIALVKRDVYASLQSKVEMLTLLSRQIKLQLVVSCLT